MTSKKSVSRRDILKIGAAGPLLAAPGLLLSQPAPIKIGLVHPVSGGLAYSGGQGRLGCQLAIDEVNAAGGIKSMGGARLQAVLGDSQFSQDMFDSSTRMWRDLFADTSREYVARDFYTALAQ